jgi:glycosyltransferase involved in cell wall biosynthesis
VASYAANLAGALAEQGAAVAVVAPVEPSEPGEPVRTTDGPISVHRCFERGPRALPAALRAATDTGAPVVHLQHEHFLYGGPASIPGLLPGLERTRRRTSTVVTLHQVVDPSTVDDEYVAVHRVRVPPSVARSALRTVQRSIAQLADACVVHERPFADTIDGSVVIPHGVEERPSAPRGAARRRLGLDHRFVVLCFGFVSPYKGLEAVLEAGELAGPDVQVVVAGGPHPRLAGSGDTYADELAARHRSARFTGWVPDADIAAWHAAADVAVLAYPRPFASSGALALAVAHGTPVLLSQPMADCIGVGAEATTPIDPCGLGLRLRGLADDPAALRGVRQATAGLQADRRWPVVADAHLRLYERVLP